MSDLEDHPFHPANVRRELGLDEPDVVNYSLATKLLRLLQIEIKRLKKIEKENEKLKEEIEQLAENSRDWDKQYSEAKVAFLESVAKPEESDRETAERLEKYWRQQARSYSPMKPDNPYYKGRGQW